MLCCTTSDFVLCSSMSVCSTWAHNPVRSDDCVRGPFLMGNCTMIPKGEFVLSSNVLLPPPLLLLRFSIKSTRLYLVSRLSSLPSSGLACTFFLFSLNLNSYVCFCVGSVCTGILSEYCDVIQLVTEEQ